LSFKEFVTKSRDVSPAGKMNFEAVFYGVIDKMKKEGHDASKASSIIEV
jgi:hypothetical protein